MVAGRLQQTEQARGPILLVDDEPYILRSLSYLLTREGYAVETASNGEEGLERLRMVHPPLVFLDIMMPRMNGYEVCEQIKQDPALATTYVIMLSAKGQQIDRERAMLGGADEYMTKPFSPREVAERVHTLLATLDTGEPARIGPERGERIESR
jgi:two-component system, OmpR family, alkaline phosphatase synthesis response regulator PhoP